MMATVVPWKVFWVVIGAVASVTTGFVLVWEPPPNRVLLVLFGAGVVSVVAWRVMSEAKVFATVRHRTLRWWVRGVVALVWCHTGWIIAFLYTSPPTIPVLLVVLVGMVGGEYGLALIAEYLQQHQQKLIPTRPVVQDPQVHRMRAVLSRVGYEHLRVLDWSPLGGTQPGDTAFGMNYTVQVPAGKDGFPPGSGKRLAVAFSEILGTSLKSDWVQVQESRTAGQWTVSVVLREVMADVVPFVDVLEWTSILTPAFIGRRLDMSPQHLVLAQHGEDIGKTRSGKSSLIHVKCAHLTRSRDAIVWVCGAEKVYDFVGGWVDCYEGTDHPLPFDWIANGQRDLVEMLIAGMNVARWRQRQRMVDRGAGWPHIVIILDEASFALGSRTNNVRGVYQGQSVNAAEMAAMISKGAGSAGVWLLRATQRSTNDHSGDHGGDVTANVGYSAAFASKDWSEVGRLTNMFSLPMPRNKGEFWLDAGEEPVLVKAPYMQEVDPTKPRLHDGPTVADVAWSRRDFIRVLDSGSAVAAGAPYANRLTRMDSAMRAYLNGEPVVEGTGLSPEQEGYAAVMATLGAQVGSVATLTGRRTRADRVREIVLTAGGAVSPGEILTVLQRQGDMKANPQLVTNATTELVREGHIVRLERGLYTGPDRGGESHVVEPLGRDECVGVGSDGEPDPGGDGQASSVSLGLG